MPSALDGLLIADFGRVLAGPYATMLLGDLGADVVKIERPDGGDDTRAWGPPFTEDGEIDVSSLERVLRQCVQAPWHPQVRSWA